MFSPQTSCLPSNAVVGGYCAGYFYPLPAYFAPRFFSFHYPTLRIDKIDELENNILIIFYKVDGPRKCKKGMDGYNKDGQESKVTNRLLRRYYYMELNDELFKPNIDKITRVMELFESGFIREHIKWMVAINAGALLWFFGNINSYCIVGKLFYKWWFIIGEAILAISLVVLYKLKICIHKLSMAFLKIKLDFLDKKIDCEKVMEELNSLWEQFPSSKTVIIGELLFLFGILIMSVYVFAFIILKK